jgi:hypothetical protein
MTRKSRFARRRRNPDRIDELIEEARERGRERGEARARWIETDGQERKLLQWLRSGDDRLFDYISEPGWLSGEWAGESPRELIGDLLDELYEQPEGEDAEDELMSAYGASRQRSVLGGRGARTEGTCRGARTKATWQARQAMNSTYRIEVSESPRSRAARPDA